MGMARKAISWLVAFALTVALFASPALAATYGYVNTKGYVRMHSGPAGSDPTTASVRGGTKVEILSASGSWVHVKLTTTGADGYIYKEYITKNKSSADTSASSAKLGFTGSTCTLKVGSSTLRTAASSSSGGVAKLVKGAEMAITGSTSLYYRVKVIRTGKKGYILKSAVKLGISARMRGKAYLRTSASTSAAAIRTVPKGASVVIYKASTGWSKVKYGSSTGYINNSYLKP